MVIEISRTVHALRVANFQNTSDFANHRIEVFEGLVELAEALPGDSKVVFNRPNQIALIGETILGRCRTSSVIVTTSL